MTTEGSPFLTGAELTPSRLILCTTGTSIAQGCPSLRRYLQQHFPWESDAQDLTAEIAQRMTKAKFKEAETQRWLSAEVNSLSRLGIQSTDEICLLATDTVEGRVCAEAVQTAIMLSFNLEDTAVRIIRIPDLQVRNATALRQRGLPGLIRCVMEERRKADSVPGRQVILNPTAGYKGVVPFLAVLGMIFSLRTVYIFEHAETLLELPPLPLTFDLHLFLRAQAALQEALRMGGISKNHYLACVTDYHPHEEELFMSYLEPNEDDSYTVSPLACILFEANSHGPTTVKLGPHARAVYDALTALSRVRFETLVAHVAQPLWRTWHIHRFPGTDLETYKQGDVPERLAGFTGADAFYLCEYYPDHDSYEADLPKRRRTQYRPERFTDWIQPDSLLKVERHFNSECDRFYAELCEKERELADQIEAAVQRETRLLREKIKDLEELGRRRAEEIAALRQENAALRTPKSITPSPSSSSAPL